MPIASTSIVRHSTTALLRRVSALHHHHHHHRRLIAAAQNPKPNPNLPNLSRKQQPNKNLLKAREVAKQFSTLSPVLTAGNLPQLTANQAVGMVASAQANFMRVIVESVPSECSTAFESERIGVELLCVVRAVLKKIKRRVLVGDKVVVGSIDWVDRRGMIENVYQRNSEIVDPPVANVDHLLVIFSVEQPKLEAFTLTRFLVEAESTGLPITLALNKCELVQEEMIIEWKTRIRSWGYEPIFCSVESKHGLESLEFILRERSTVIVGPSGVGKSSLINSLRSNPHHIHEVPEAENGFEPILGSKLFEDQRVGEVSTRSGRGKHTTRHVSLLPLSGGGYLADTPGFNQPSLMKVTKQSLAQAFPEIRRMFSSSEHSRCSFSNCLHIGEPGCIVKGDWERYAYYLQLLDEIKVREEFQLRTLGTKRESDVRYKVGDMGVKQAEPRLELKKHRRQSRKRVNQSLINELDELDDDDDNQIDATNDPILRAMELENQ